MKHITAKLGNMRKAAEWTVYPNQGGSERDIVIQSDHRIAQFNRATGNGMLSKHVSNSGFLHLSKFMGATDVVVPTNIIQAALDAQPKSGDEVGAGVTIA